MFSLNTRLKESLQIPGEHVSVKYGSIPSRCNRFYYGHYCKTTDSSINRSLECTIRYTGLYGDLGTRPSNPRYPWSLNQKKPCSRFKIIVKIKAIVKSNFLSIKLKEFEFKSYKIFLYFYLAISITVI